MVLARFRQRYQPPAVSAMMRAATDSRGIMRFTVRMRCLVSSVLIACSSGPVEGMSGNFRRSASCCNCLSLSRNSASSSAFLEESEFSGVCRRSSDMAPMVSALLLLWRVSLSSMTRSCSPARRRASSSPAHSCCGFSCSNCCKSFSAAVVLPLSNRRFSVRSGGCLRLRGIERCLFRLRCRGCYANRLKVRDEGGLREPFCHRGKIVQQ